MRERQRETGRQTDLQTDMTRERKRGQTEMRWTALGCSARSKRANDTTCSPAPKSVESSVLLFKNAYHIN